MQQTSSFIRSFVRREGRFTKAQRAALEEHWPKYGINIKQNQRLDLEQVFQNRQPVVIDIGFGNGESLITLAAQHSQLNFLGVEVYRPGIGNLLRNAFEAELENVRAINIDVVELLENNIVANSFMAALIWFADPWPKKRHHKRRLIQIPFLQLLAEKLVVDGELNIATDWQPYAEHIQEKVQESNLFKDLAESSFIQQRPQTKFERRGEKLGHRVSDLIYSKKSR
ncbi:MAG: tRNA (guanosine(46)-N7)-methyltransferase TrmB [Gammaproteobacteria bacterium]